jgi:hypothetical protein
MCYLWNPKCTTSRGVLCPGVVLESCLSVRMGTHLRLPEPEHDLRMMRAVGWEGGHPACGSLQLPRILDKYHMPVQYCCSGDLDGVVGPDGSLSKDTFPHSAKDDKALGSWLYHGAMSLLTKEFHGLVHMAGGIAPVKDVLQPTLYILRPMSDVRRIVLTNNDLPG